MRPPWEPQVYLVGAGPGDPQLLTRRGEQALRRAHVVFYDFLTNVELLDLAPPKAEKVFVGKRAGGPNPTQESINAQIVAEALKGRTVVRLKGGDSFVFGRGGEEAEALLRAGIRFEVVPGVTSATAVPALAGIPVTHRDFNSVLHIVTGHEDPFDPSCSVRWDLLAQSSDTIVVLMGSGQLGAIVKRLLQEGMPPETPFALVHWGTYPHQRSERGRLGDFERETERFAFGPPSIAVIGKIAASAEGLNWFERRPLFGQRIVLARSGDSNREIAEALSEAGAQVESFGVIHFQRESVDQNGWRIQLDRLRNGGWLILPSPAAIRHAFESLREIGWDARALGGIRIASVGERSAEELRLAGIEPDLVPDTATGTALAAEIPLERNRQPVLIAGSNLSRPELAEALERRGFEVERLTLYRTEPNAPEAERLWQRLRSAGSDAIVLFSPSAVEAVMATAAPEDAALLKTSNWFAIGPTTASAIERRGLKLAGVAAEPSAAGLFDALAGRSSAAGEQAAG